MAHESKFAAAEFVNIFLFLAEFIAFIESASKCERSNVLSTLVHFFLTKLTNFHGIGAPLIDEFFGGREQA